MNEEYVSLKVALLAKKLGFDLGCRKFWELFGNPTEPFEPISPDNFNSKHWNKVVSAPTLSVLAKWIREIFNIHVKVDHFIETEDDFNYISWDYCVGEIGADVDEKGNMKYLIDYSSDDTSRIFDNFENAFNEGLFQTLLIIDDMHKTKNNKHENNRNK